MDTIDYAELAAQLVADMYAEGTLHNMHHLAGFEATEAEIAAIVTENLTPDGEQI